MTGVKKLLTEIETKAAETKGDIISLLKADHRNVELLFAEYEKTSASVHKRALLERIIEELNVHTTAEEKLVYPALEKEDKEGALEAFEEHHIVENVLQELMSVGEIDEQVDAKVKVLSELVKHHVKEEETKLLPEMKKSGIDLEEMGEEFRAGKESLKMKPPKPGQANSKAKEFKKKAS
ncbi:MAG TPA: hemerythrin domain-containing protein [Oculatellaceae cyanobacterium]